MRPKPSVWAQLADVRAWAAGGPDPDLVTLLDYVGFAATPDLLFAFADLFWPDLVVHEGLRFLASGFTVDTYEQWRRSGRSPEEIQRVMNHVHVSTLLQQKDVSDETAVEAARIIAGIWGRTLGPEDIVAEAMGTELADAAVTFHERHEAAKKSGAAPRLPSR